MRLDYIELVKLSDSRYVIFIQIKIEIERGTRIRTNFTAFQAYKF